MKINRHLLGQFGNAIKLEFEPDPIHFDLGHLHRSARTTFRGAQRHLWRMFEKRPDGEMVPTGSLAGGHDKLDLAFDGVLGPSAVSSPCLLAMSIRRGCSREGLVDSSLLSVNRGGCVP